MTDENALITVYRSGDPSAEADATAARDCLTQAGIQAVLLSDDTPGVIEGTWEVRVPPSDRTRAEAILESQACEPEDDQQVPQEGLSHDLDFVSFFGSQAADSEMEAIMIQSILESNDIPCIVVGSAQYPSLGFEVRVPKSRLKEAVAAVEAARQSGATVEGESA
jgi:hypothetical protein